MLIAHYVIIYYRFCDAAFHTRFSLSNAMLITLFMPLHMIFTPYAIRHVARRQHKRCYASDVFRFYYAADAALLSHMLDIYAILITPCARHTLDMPLFAYFLSLPVIAFFAAFRYAITLLLFSPLIRCSMRAAADDIIAAATAFIIYADAAMRRH